MAYLAVIVAAIAGFAIGAVWYGVLSKQWIKAAGITVGADGKPEGGSPLLMGFGFLCVLVVAGMMRHAFIMSGINTPMAGLVAGLGIGLFFITPWITLNALFGMKPKELPMIDGGYATLGCGVMGLVLTLF
ncbi:DUF1761 domain-containing protein [Pararhodobacter oceanensis]|uniref:DUF1761 domain-containing protein n=1 Tax=Pararhodobacter oceanensis TaxID=2172121 RepID=UPI003A8D449D